MNIQNKLKAQKGLLKYVAATIFLIVVGVILCRSDPPAKVVRLGYLPMISSLTYFVALDQGFFVQEGVKVEGIPIQTSNEICRSLVDGKIDLAAELAVIPLINTLTPGSQESAPFEIFSISSITAENGFDSVLARKASEINNLEGLSGKNIGVFPGTTAERTIIDIFNKKFPNKKPPTITKLSPALHLSSLENGSVDAIHAYEPFLSVGLVKFGFKRIATSLYAEQQSPSPIGVAALNRKWRKENKRAADASVRALDNAAEFIKNFPDKSRMIAAKYTGAAPEIASVMNIMPMSISKEVNVNVLNDYFIKLKSIGETNHTPDASKLCYK